ncbi:MAG: OmpA family protein [Pseudomonadota bacterium]|nr:OmpA family protein [Pseudomonadota bacterium]MDE3037959.1 OmpA family protein [Pseudomonadota bacterium]
MPPISIFKCRLFAAAVLVLTLSIVPALAQQENPAADQPSIELNLHALDQLKQPSAAEAAPTPEGQPRLIWVEGPKGHVLSPHKRKHRKNHGKKRSKKTKRHPRKRPVKKTPPAAQKKPAFKAKPAAPVKPPAKPAAQVQPPAPKPVPIPLPPEPAPVPPPKPVPVPLPPEPAPVPPPPVSSPNAAPALPTPPKPIVAAPPAAQTMPVPVASPAPKPAAQKAPTETAPVKAVDEALSAPSGNAKKANFTITFKSTETTLPLSVKSELDAHIKPLLLAHPDLRVRLAAYASNVDDQPSTARRIALSRALSVRAYLIDAGVNTMRIMVEAEGDKNPGGNPDRVDVFVEPQQQ